MTSGTIDNIPRSRRIIQAFGIRDSVGNGSQTLIEVFMPEKSNVYSVFNEDRLECGLAGVTFGFVNIPRTVAGNNDPWRLLPVDRGKILPKPIKLRTTRREGTCIFSRTSSGKIRCIWELRANSRVRRGERSDNVCAGHLNIHLFPY